MNETLGATCIYHRKRPADSICQSCRSPICYEDVKNVRTRSFWVKYDLCLDCYNDRFQGAETILALFIISCIIIIAVVVYFAIQTGQGFSSNINGILFDVFIVLILATGAFIYSRRKIKETTEKILALRFDLNDQNYQNRENINVKDPSRPIFKYLYQGKNVSINTDTCKFCGQKLLRNDTFCSNCGKQRN